VLKKYASGSAWNFFLSMALVKMPQIRMQWKDYENSKLVLQENNITPWGRGQIIIRV
jgi:hypothetical protein